MRSLAIYGSPGLEYCLAVYRPQLQANTSWKDTVEWLYEKHFNKLHGMAFRKLADKSKVRDVVQEVFKRLLSKERQFDSEESAEKFLYRSFKNLLCTRFPSIDVEEAADGKEAFQKIADHVPEIVFMDIKLPGENGLQITKKVKAKYPEIIVIILTYYDSPEHREAAMQCGANHFFSKGASTQEVVELLQSIISEKGLDANEG